MTAPRMRAGTSDRQGSVDGLTRHFTEGRLDAGEFDERVRRAYAAVYLDELPELFADLPDAQPRHTGGPVARWPGPERHTPGGPPGSWSRSYQPQFLRPPRILVFLPVLALGLVIGALTHGLFLFPLIWIALFLTFRGGHGHRRPGAGPYARHNNRW